MIRDRCPDVDITSNNLNETVPQDGAEGIAAAQTRRESSTVEGSDANHIAHEIGLIPFAGGADPKYVGPSSGFSFTKVLLARAGQNRGTPQSFGTLNEQSPSAGSIASLQIEASSLPSTAEQAIQLSKVYFEHVPVEYPFLHEPTYYQTLAMVYRTSEVNAIAKFQVTMVLAISVNILSKRTRIPFSDDGLCVAAMRLISDIDLQGSLQGVQCLLLMLMFTMYSPFLGTSPWHLSYQCLASVLDLGLQRDVPLGPKMSSFEQEMRTRIFWVIYTIDRKLATTLGRPIGLRDEACDLRLPTDIEDDSMDVLSSQPYPARESWQTPTKMTCAIALFKLAHLNSEIKYILHSVNHTAPRFTLPQIPDINRWQEDFWQRLQQQGRELPILKEEKEDMNVTCQLRYNEIVMLLFRPTPRIKSPNATCLKHCHKASENSIRLWHRLYELNRMSYSWMSIHRLCLAVVTMLYCIWTVTEIAAETQLDDFFTTMRISSNLLSAAGEHWPEARRSRQTLEELMSATVRWLLDTKSKSASRQRTPARDSSSRNRRPLEPSQVQPVNTFAPNAEQTLSGDRLPDFTPEAFDIPGIDTYINVEDLANFVGAPSMFATDLSLTMDGMFSDFQPTFDFDIMDGFGRRNIFQP